MHSKQHPLLLLFPTFLITFIFVYVFIGASFYFNLFFDFFGVNGLLQRFGMPPLKPGWTTDASVVLSLNQALVYLWPAGAKFQIEWGVPVALFPVTIAATWQLSGFVMAMYLGGLAGIPDEVRESTRIDGANEWQAYRKVLIPMLKPVTISTVIILLHASLKIFDLE